MNRPNGRSLAVRLEGIESRGQDERLIGKAAALWNHLGLPIRSQVTAVRDDSGRVTVTASRAVADHPLRRIDVLL